LRSPEGVLPCEVTRQRIHGTIAVTAVAQFW